MRLPTTVLVVCSLAASLSAQGPIVPPPKTPPVNSQMRDREVVVTVEGCVRGNRLKLGIRGEPVAPAVRLLNASEFSLEGPKELLRQLQKDHDGHQDEITGIAVVPAAREDDGYIETKEVGKRTRIVAGTSSTKTSETSPMSSTSRIVRLKVQSLTHLANRCSV
jgi:hypothetical protein